MGLLDFASGALEFLDLDDIVGDFLVDFSTDFLGGAGSTFLSGWGGELISGAVTNAAVTALAGGDIGKAALFGAAGGAVGDNMIGAAVKGYGLADANDGNGLIGAAAGAAGQYASDNFKSSSSAAPAANVAQSGGGVPSNPANPPAGVMASSGAPSSSGGTITDKLQSFGLIDASGEGTLLGKSLVQGIAGMSAVKTAEDVEQQKQDNALDRDSHQANLEHQNEQKRIAAFGGPQQYKIVR